LKFDGFLDSEMADDFNILIDLIKNGNFLDFFKKPHFIFITSHLNKIFPKLRYEEK